MPQITSGSVLRETRERKNYDLNTVARRLRIRPDILRAIEASDFTGMPPRGYTRNMVNAYARFLGLNPTEIVNMYLDEAYAYQVERARSSAPGSGFVMEGSYQRRPRVRTRTGSDGDAYGYRAKSTYASYFEPEEEPAPLPTGLRKRHLYDDSTRYAHDEYGVKRESVKRADRSERDFLSHHSGYDATYRSAVPEGIGRQAGSRRSRERSIHVGQTPMEYSAPRFAGLFQSRFFVIGAIIAVVVIIALIVFFVTGNNKSTSDDVSQLPVSGITDTTGTSESSSAEEAQVEIAPTSARVNYTVKSGDQCYVEMYTDGNLSGAELYNGPVNETIEVTGTWTITTWSADTIEVSVDGEPVKLTSNEEYGGMYAYTVDFNKILEEWNSTHNNSKTSQRQAAVASANAAAQNAKSESESSSSSSSSSSSAAAGSSSSSAASA